MPQTAFPTVDRTSPLTPCSTHSAPLHLLTPFKMCRCLTVPSFQSWLLPGFQEPLARSFGVSDQKSTECLLCIRQHAQAWGKRCVKITESGGGVNWETETDLYTLLGLSGLWGLVMHREAWRAAVHGVARSCTSLSV